MLALASLPAERRRGHLSLALKIFRKMSNDQASDDDYKFNEPSMNPMDMDEKVQFLPVPSTSPTVNKKQSSAPTDLRPRLGRKQAWDAWRPGPYGPPAPPSMERRLAEESALEMAAMMGHGRQDGRARKIRPRRTVDVGGSMTRWTLMRSLRTCPDEHYFIRPCIDHLIELLPPQAYSTNLSTSILTKYVHTSTNKIRCPINVVRFTPDARRVLTGATSGEFTLWNGLTFNFETILQAHDTAVRALDWSKSGVWLVSGDNNGIIKYFQPNMNNLQMFEGHKDSIRDISFSPNDSRFVSCGDDGMIKVWGFEERREERNLAGHGWDVKCIKWHPTKGLLCSGGKDSLVKFWDPRIGKCLTTLHGHKNSVQACAWNPSGHSIATASRDSMIKVFDIRMMKELANLRGHKKEVCSLTWHPIHHDLLTSGGSDGSIFYWCLPDSDPIDSLDFAHDSNVWSLDYHPLGHTLVSGSNDHTTRFWSRGRPGVKISNDRFHIGKERAREMGVKDEEEQVDDFFVPGLGNQYGLTATGTFLGAGAFGQLPAKESARNSTDIESHLQMSAVASTGGFSTNNTGGPAGLRLSVGPRLSETPSSGNPSTDLTSIPGFGRAIDTSESALPGLTINPTQSSTPPASSWRRAPLPSQEAAMGRDLGGFGDKVSSQGGKSRWRSHKGNNTHNRQPQSRWQNSTNNQGGIAGGPHLDEFGREIPNPTSSAAHFR
ncbi:hypothetical protein O181_005075 [Austropuccinia psidii MF-1]|uniref:Polyadenylation factor subunit 2 n=1 Tax=Austropuccinia psidii MF-1 TaxID=1389203 RepID=A0A9Q3BI94_9BASI|nr:hypothetical protein [Austropuccinia psidii MF-1]